MNNFPIGTQVKIVIPSQFPDWLENWTQTLFRDRWKNHLRLINTVIVAEITDTPVDYLFDNISVKLYYFNLAGNVGIPEEWLQNLNPTISNCDCPLSKIMIRGCKNRSHQ